MGLLEKSRGSSQMTDDNPTPEDMSLRDIRELVFMDPHPELDDASETSSPGHQPTLKGSARIVGSLIYPFKDHPLWRLEVRHAGGMDFTVYVYQIQSGASKHYNHLAVRSSAHNLSDVVSRAIANTSDYVGRS